MLLLGSLKSRYPRSSITANTTILSTISLLVLLSAARATTHAFVWKNVPHRAASRTFTSTSSSSLAMSKKRVLVPIADGSEEIETTCITDTLTRFGADVTIASVSSSSLTCTMSRGIKVQADTTMEKAVAEGNNVWDCIVLPGGMPGAEHLRDCAPLTELLKKQKESGKLYGAICAAPAVALQANGLIDKGGQATCYPAPGFRSKLENVSEANVVVTGNLVTSQGPGTALLFALELGQQLYGKEKRNEIADQMLVK